MTHTGPLASNNNKTTGISVGSA